MPEIFRLSGTGPTEPGVIDVRGIPNLFGLEWLHQDKTWTDATGHVWQLEKMDPRHRRNVLNVLERNAFRLVVRDYMLLTSGPFGPQGDMACDAFDREMDDAFDNPLPVLRGYKLIKRLTELVAEDQRVYDEGTNWWEEG